MQTEEVAALPFSVEQFLPLPGNPLHHQRLWIMLFATLAAARFRHMETSDLPPSSRLLPGQHDGVLQRQGYRQRMCARRKRKLVDRLHPAYKGLGKLRNILPHIGLSPDKLILDGPDKGDILC